LLTRPWWWWWWWWCWWILFPLLTRNLDRIFKDFCVLWWFDLKEQKKRMYKSVVYQGEVVLGEVEVYPEENNYKNFHVKEIRISHFSQPSERCPPLAVLHTVTSCGVCFKMESKTQQQDGLFHLHSLCIRENKVYSNTLKN